MRNGIPELVPARLRMWKILERGYLTSLEKVHRFLSEDQDLPEEKIVITQAYETNPDTRNRSPKPPRPEDKQSKRIYGGRRDITVVYPRSGKVYPARIKRWKDWVAIEPVKKDRAFWLVRDKFLVGDVVDFNVVDHIRKIHNKTGREILSNYR